MTAVIIPAEQATTCPATATGVCLVLRMAASMAMADARQTSVHRFHLAVSLLAVHIFHSLSTLVVFVMCQPRAAQTERVRIQLTAAIRAFEVQAYELTTILDDRHETDINKIVFQSKTDRLPANRIHR